MELGGQHLIHHYPSTQIFSFNFRPFRDTKGEQALEPQGSCYMPTFSTTLGWIARIVTHGRKKFTLLRRWKSFSASGGQLANCLADPKTSSPSRCGAQ
jgi:hypothetical protein